MKENDTDLLNPLAKPEAPSGDSDISGGLANLGETVNAANELNDYNK